MREKSKGQLMFMDPNIYAEIILEGHARGPSYVAAAYNMTRRI
jgi:hypothetical protein